MQCSVVGSSRDLLSSPRMTAVFFGIPVLGLVLTSVVDLSRGWRTVIWTAALAIMGTACMVNALRCGRVHCYLTGPFFLITAIAALLYGIDVLPLGGHGWSLLGLVTLIGAIVLCCLPEMFLGKYRRGRTRQGG